jgi:hypothetical protein
MGKMRDMPRLERQEGLPLRVRIRAPFDLYQDAIDPRLLRLQECILGSPPPREDQSWVTPLPCRP